MKRAIIVKGKSSCGKSTIIRWVYRWLRLYYPTVLHSSWGNPVLDHDFGCSFSIGSLKITINSAGDFGHEVQAFLTTAITGPSDLIIGACRDRGGTKSAMMAVLNPLSPTKTVVTSFVHTHHHHSVRAFNKQCARELRTLLIGLS